MSRHTNKIDSLEDVLFRQDIFLMTYHIHLCLFLRYGVMKKYLLSACLVFIMQSVFAQTIIIDGKEEDRPLRWSDFKGVPDNNSPYAAMTSWNLKVSMKSKSTNGGPANIQELDIALEFNPKKSWVKTGKANDELLKHEQGHFDIGRLCLLEMLQVMKTIPPKEQVTKLPVLYQELMQKYHEMGLRYDKETNHCLIREKQLEWNHFLDAEEKRLRAL